MIRDPRTGEPLDPRDVLDGPDLTNYLAGRTTPAPAVHGPTPCDHTSGCGHATGTRASLRATGADERGRCDGLGAGHPRELSPAATRGRLC